MKIKTTLPLLLLGFATVGSDTFGMSCGYKVTNGVDIATNLAQGTSVGVQIQCSESNPAIVDPQFKFSWAPPFEPSFGDSGASIVYGSTPNLVSTGVLEVTCCDPALDPLCGSGGGGTCDPADPSCTGRHKNDSPKRCRPDDPNCGKNGTMAFFDPKTFRDFRIYKKFKKILVAKSKRDTGDLVCTQVDVKIFDGIPVISTPPCGDNCVAPPTQNPTGTGDNGPDHQCGGTSGGELPKPRSASNFRSCGLPVNVATGAMWHQFTDFSIPGRTPDTEISFVRTYTSSPAQQPGPLGIRWQHNYQTHIERSSVPGSQDLNWVDENGNADLFKRQSDGSFNAPPGDLEVLTPFSDHFELKKTNGTVYFYYGFNASNGGMIYKITDVHGETVSFSYDDSGNLTSVSSPFAGVVNITHNGVRLITSITRERDNLTYNYGYDSFNRLSSVTDFAGRTYTYSYIDDKPGLATAGLLSSFTDPIGRVTSFTYDDQGRANNQYEPGGGKWNYLYGDHQTSVTAPNGGVTKYFFDANLREIEEVAPNSAINYKSWTDSAAISRQRSEYGGTTMWTYDANGNATSYRRPEDKSPKQVTYDLKFNVATLIQPSVGAATQKVLDPNTGDVLQEVRAGLTLSHTYDKFGNVLSTSNGRATYADQRDANGFLTHLFDLHNPQTLTYDTRGRVTSRSYLSGRVITYTYNDDDQVLVTADSAGPTTSNTYDAMKRLVKSVVSAGGANQVTTTQYDDRDRVVSTTDAMGRTTVFSYDSVQLRDKPSAITDPAGRTTHFAYDSLDRLITKTDALGAATTFAYDKSGNMTSVIDANGNVTRYVYDLNDRKISEIRPSVAGQTAATLTKNFFYDAADHLIREEDNGHRVISYQYDSLDRLVSKTIATDGTVEDVSTFNYENQTDASLMNAAANGVATIRFSNEAAPPFSLLGFQVAAGQAGNPLGLIEGTFGITRDVTGEINGVSKDGSSIYTKSYDPAGRLTGVQAGSFSTAIGYDAFGRKQTIRHSDGAAGSFQYDLLNRIYSSVWTGPTPISEQLTYDLAGNITQVQRENGTSNISYDADDQLLSSTGLYSKTFAYDLLGNRLQDSANGPGSFVSNFLTSNGTSSFTADPDGFGDVVKEVSGGVTKNYVFRADDRMVGYSDGSNQVVYYYDALRRRVAKVISGAAGNFTQSYLHLGTQDQILLAKAGDGSITTYLDAAADEHLAEVKNGTGKGLVTDHLGSVLNDDAAGSGHSFGLFGEPINTVAVGASSNPVMYGFTGREYEPESALSFHRSRVYEPRVGRWLSQDSVGNGSGDSNFYRYVGNHPASSIDRDGKWEVPVIILGVMVGAWVLNQRQWMWKNTHQEPLPPPTPPPPLPNPFPVCSIHDPSPSNPPIPRAIYLSAPPPWWDSNWDVLGDEEPPVHSGPFPNGPPVSFGGPAPVGGH